MLPHERLGPPRIWGIGVVAMGWRVGTEHCCWRMTNVPFFCTMRSISSRCVCGCCSLYALVPAVGSISSACSASYLQLIVRDQAGRAIISSLNSNTR